MPCPWVLWFLAPGATLVCALLFVIALLASCLFWLYVADALRWVFKRLIAPVRG